MREAGEMEDASAPLDPCCESPSSSPTTEAGSRPCVDTTSNFATCSSVTCRCDGISKVTGDRAATAPVVQHRATTTAK